MHDQVVDIAVAEARGDSTDTMKMEIIPINAATIIRSPKLWRIDLWLCVTVYTQILRELVQESSPHIVIHDTTRLLLNQNKMERPYLA